jgi:hypothetical protein
MWLLYMYRVHEHGTRSRARKQSKTLFSLSYKWNHGADNVFSGLGFEANGTENVVTIERKGDTSSAMPPETTLSCHRNTNKR